MDTSLQMQGIKLQIDHMKMQIENIITQNNNRLMLENIIGDQLLNLSIQMLNTGIQAFSIGCNLSKNINNFYVQLKKIGDQINNLVNSHQMMLQNMVLQQQMMDQQIMNQMIPQQMIQYKKQKINAYFLNRVEGKLNMVIEEDCTVKELFDKYMQITGENIENSYFLVFGVYKLIRNDQKK